ncbi:hypothetical protein PYW08_001532 [Mythimna loreyi]|uniref:Uncharacterized protein n=1 Tax=Mythimna loreyi TaxID=667449 RepID=A0ACC2R4T3_9NEOP|nr:hypothetical protein PYW08_001532 [Mythimna loreyi]
MKKYIVLFMVLFTSARCFNEEDNHVKVISLSCEQVRAFVDGHNARRYRIARGEVAGQPAASDMNMMVWDEELSAKASRWVKKNLHKHNPDKSVRSKRFTVGENMYRYSTTNPKYVLQPDSALESWFNEHVNYTFGPIQMSDFQKDYQIGHYTQMVWSKSVYIGCAISQTFKNGWNKFFVVCNYGPAGNFLGQKPYSESSGRSNKLICDAELNDKCDSPYGSKCDKNS